MFDLSMCPVCGAKLAEHEPESDSDFEYWSFDCYLMVYRADGRLWADNNCEEITNLVLKKLNAEATAKVALTSGQR